ncbi:recombinase family protein, partial [Salmonella enterica subsp. enterica serovar Typhimurium]|nr:recombinase family protein [Salmonella enterica subsp. enterica serovar Typhimurium]
MGSCAAPSAKGDDKFITTDYLQQCHMGQMVVTILSAVAQAER